MPQTWCWVPKCKNSGGHKFPSDPKLRKKWINAVRRAKEVPRQTSVVCHGHFTADQYEEKNIYGRYTVLNSIYSYVKNIF